MDKIKVRGEWLLGVDEVRNGIVDVFKDLLTYFRDWRVDPVGLNFSILDEAKTTSLEVPFSVE